MDACGKCRLPSDNSPLPCLDCFGVANGEAAFDRCGVCDGDGTSCLDCAGEPFGVNETDLCGDCRDPEDDEPGGFNDGCRDCFGIPLGSAVNDRCDVCDGDDSSCFLPVTLGILIAASVLFLCLICCGIWLTAFRRDGRDDDNANVLANAYAAGARPGVARKIRLPRARAAQGVSGAVNYGKTGRGGVVRRRGVTDAPFGSVGGRRGDDEAREPLLSDQR